MSLAEWKWNGPISKVMDTFLLCYKQRKENWSFVSFFVAVDKPENRCHSTDTFMLLVVSKRKKIREKNSCYPSGKGSLDHFTALWQYTNISVMKMESNVKITASDFGPWVFDCNCKAHLWMCCASVSHMYACTRRQAGLWQHQTAFDLDHPFSANKNVRELTPPPPWYLIS